MVLPFDVAADGSVVVILTLYGCVSIAQFAKTIWAATSTSIAPLWPPASQKNRSRRTSVTVTGLRHGRAAHSACRLSYRRPDFHIEKGQPAKTERPLANGSKNCSYVCRHCYSRLYALRDARRRSADGNAGQNQLHPPSGSNLDKQRPSLGDVEDDGILSYSEQPANFGPLIEAWKAAR